MEPSSVFQLRRGGILRTRILPPSAVEVIDIVRKSNPTWRDFLPLLVGNYRIYGVTADDKIHVLGLNHTGQIVLLSKHSTTYAMFEFRESFMSKYFFNIFADGLPVNRCVDQRNVSVYSRLNTNWTVGRNAGCDTICFWSYDDTAMRPKELSWGVSYAAGHSHIELKDPNHLDSNDVVKLHFKQIDIPLARGTYNIFCVDMSNKLRGLSVTDRGHVVFLPSNALDSEYAEFNFSFVSEDERGTFMAIDVNGARVIPWEGGIKCAGSEAFAWEVVRRESEIYYIFLNDEDQDEYERLPRDRLNQKCWVGEDLCDSPIPLSLCLGNFKDFTSPALMFIRPIGDRSVAAMT